LAQKIRHSWRAGIGVVGACLLFSGCALTPAANGEHPLGWMSGCWQNAEGDYREVWSAPDHDYLFGYALSLKGDKVSFFEQSRIAPGRKGYVFNVYPGGKGPVAFPATGQEGDSVEFVNPDNDFPQRIRYARDGNRMIATISLLDGSKGQGFAFRPCR